MSDNSSSRIAGIVTIATGVAAFALLLNHPAETATDFAGVLKEEAANQAINAIVHGGFIVVLAVQLACYAILTSRISVRSLAIAALAFFAVGAAIQMAQLFVDGLLIPQIAARYVTAPPDRLPFAKSLFVLAGSAVQLLMPMGLPFQSVGIVTWGMSLFRTTRLAGLLTIALGLAVFAVVVGAAMTGAQMLLMAGIAGLSLWPFIAGLLMVRRAV